MDVKLLELEPRVSHSFKIKMVLIIKLFKVLTSSQSQFCFKISFCVRYHKFVFVILKLYLWLIHMANKLILASSFASKLNSKLKIDRCIFRKKSTDDRIGCRFCSRYIVKFQIQAHWLETRSFTDYDSEKRQVEHNLKRLITFPTFFHQDETWCEVHCRWLWIFFTR